MLYFCFIFRSLPIYFVDILIIHGWFNDSDHEDRSEHRNA